MKIAIIGSGAMGSLYGGRLAISGNEVVLYDINREHVEKVNRDGLWIEELEAGKRSVAKPCATTNPLDVKDSGILIIFVKSTATKVVAQEFKSWASKDAIVVTFQNGVGNEAILKKQFGAERTAAGVTSQGATFLGPGIIRHAGKGPTYLCMSDKKNEKLDAFVQALNNAGFETH
ncbi:MAG: 2-dehydropantoate 2-reductase, partial [Spirochaetota bacterium]